MDEIKNIIQDISNLADSTSKAVLTTYNPEEDHGVNKGNLIKHTVEYLERCASFLNIELLNNHGKKLFANKAALADRVILVIESFFPTTCLDCNSSYQIKFGDPEPPIRCLFCLQGSHCCDARLTSLKALKKLTGQCLSGIAWLCKSCFTKNNSIGLTQFSSPSPVSTSAIDNHSEQPVCEDYRRGKCAHGISGNKEVDGEKCKFKHPKKCMKWCRHGKSLRHGCSKGEQCDKFHPILCKFALTKG